MFKLKSLFDLEKKSVFLINLGLVLLIVLTFLLDWKLEYFFYFNIFITLIISYFFFQKSKKLAKTLIVTNMFIFFYFLYPKVAIFLTELFGSESYLFILFYTIFLSYIFLVFSGENNTFLGDLKSFSFKIVFLIMLLGFSLSLLFIFVQEPVPSLFIDVVEHGTLGDYFKFIILSTLIIALAEQLIFSAFLFNSYSKLTSRMDAFYQTSIIFVLFHMLRFDILVKYYYVNFPDFFLFYISLYYIFLFLFMILCIYLYSFNWKGKKGNFIYPVLLHFFTDLGLFLFYAVPIFILG